MSKVQVLAVSLVALGALVVGGCGSSSGSTNATTQASHTAAMKQSNEAMHKEAAAMKQREAMHHEASSMKKSESAAAMKQREAMHGEASNMKKQAESAGGQTGG